jgi:hypothetical protein
MFCDLASTASFARVLQLTLNHQHLRPIIEVCIRQREVTWTTSRHRFVVVSEGKEGIRGTFRGSSTTVRTTTKAERVMQHHVIATADTHARDLECPPGAKSPPHFRLLDLPQELQDSIFDSRTRRNQASRSLASLTGSTPKWKDVSESVVTRWNLSVRK